MTGRLIGVVGPSGVGKDSVMAGLVEADPQLALVRRTITREPELGGEDYTPATQAAFDRLVAKGAFCASPTLAVLCACLFGFQRFDTE
ncbi:MAG: hypothetical protein AAFY80_15680 [Pseudomonadota bacterium]